MEERGCPPKNCTYNTIIRGLVNNNEKSRAMKLNWKMVERGFSTDASTEELIVDQKRIMAFIDTFES
ncbi:hypothetical protein DVH24_017540 [Malus domestica]|uniref:Pentatricopeptide repeat-containing protein n=1 Tax=Malus domestica TaxID=3750 RepID=A0A498IRE3_MALDO|nr:hypothetical protein DVH24_032755 [Malus domestica]RXI09685.1 hypothetical protein DVH24_017540 [Malus domestica]